MAKPTSVPGWTASGVEPNGGKKSLGWLAGEMIPANYFNWWFTLVSSWIDYLDAGDLEANEVYHGTRTRTIQAAAAHPTTSGVTYDAANGRWSITATAGKVYFPIDVNVGDRILAVRVRVTDENQPTVVTATLYKVTPTPAKVEVGQEDDSAGDGSYQTLSIASLGTGETVTDSGYVLEVEVDPSPSVACFVYGVEVDYDRPAP